MERLTISVSDDFAAKLAAFMRRHGYENRSEAVRDLARFGLGQAVLRDEVAGECVATLSYVYDHRSRDLPKRLTDAYHAHHDLQVATMHVHLDPESCLEAVVLRGGSDAVQDLANSVMAERGVMHGTLATIPIAAVGGVDARQKSARHRHPTL